MLVSGIDYSVKVFDQSASEPFDPAAAEAVVTANRNHRPSQRRAIPVRLLLAYLAAAEGGPPTADLRAALGLGSDSDDDDETYVEIPVSSSDDDDASSNSSGDGDAGGGGGDGGEDGQVQCNPS